MANTKPLFLVHYRDPKDGKLLSLRARHISDSTLGLSFICISDFVFDTCSLVIKPTEEQLKKRLENVKNIHLSIYTIMSIEELSEKNLRFKEDKSKLLVISSHSKDMP